MVKRTNNTRDLESRKNTLQTNEREAWDRIVVRIKVARRFNTEIYHISLVIRRDTREIHSKDNILTAQPLKANKNRQII